MAFCVDGLMNPDAVSYAVDCCRFQLLNADGKIIFESNLKDLVLKCASGGNVVLRDGITDKNFTEGDAVNLGFTDLAAFQVYILAQRAECCEEAAGGLELVCVEENDNLYILDISVVPPVLTDFEGNEVTGLTPTVCRDITFDTEKEFFCVDGVDYTRNDCIKKDIDGTILEVNSFWQDITGAVITDPTTGAISIVKGSCDCEVKVITVEQKYDVISVAAEICTGVISSGRIEIANVGESYNITVNVNGTDITQSFTNTSAAQMNTDVATWLQSVAGGIWNFNFGADTNGNIGALGFDWLNVPNSLGVFNITETTSAGAGVTFDLSASCVAGGVDSSECVAIQEIKEKQCDGTETYRFVIEDGNGLLIEYILQGELSNENLCNNCTTLDSVGTLSSWAALKK